jgi:hypothetical protein
MEIRNYKLKIMNGLALLCMIYGSMAIIPLCIRSAFPRTQRDPSAFTAIQRRDAMLVSNFFLVTEALKHSRDRAYNLGYIEGEIDMNRRIWSLVEPTNNP